MVSKAFQGPKWARRLLAIIELKRQFGLHGVLPNLKDPGPNPAPATKSSPSDQGVSLHLTGFFNCRLLACIIQPGAPRFEKMQVERYVVVLLLSAGHASASPVVDQRWDLHLFVG